MERLTHKRENGIKRGYWSPNKKQELVDRLAMYEDREENDEFGKWIPYNDILPELDEHKAVKVEVLQSGFLFSTEADLGRYQMICRLIYEQEV